MGPTRVLSATLSLVLNGEVASIGESASGLSVCSLDNVTSGSSLEDVIEHAFLQPVGFEKSLYPDSRLVTILGILSIGQTRALLERSLQQARTSALSISPNLLK